MAFSPIAVVGQGCVLPGALDPDSLWHALMRGEDLLSRVPAGAWRGSHDRLLQGPGSGGEGCVTDRGGFVTGFDKVFDPAAYRIDRELLLQLDALVRWICHAGAQTLADAGIAPDHRLRARTGAIFGNLSYPTVRLAEYAENIWLGSRAAGRAHAARPTHPLNRFSSGLPAHLLCEALGLGAGGFALDAACASSLYAIKLACDWLHDGRADAMLAGGVNAIEGLTLHAGFTALGALSPSGRSRPFHAAADGLVPSEGAAFLLLKRLADAEADGNRILGVIRGIGLSNDGRASGILVPDRGGQERAMRTAYREAGLAPRDITLLECHATGTLVGDATEIASTGAVFDGCAGVRIGAAKSNLGHLVTASGAVGLMKLLAAMRHRRIPPTIHLDRPIAALADSPFRVVTDAEAWDSPGPLRAAISSFGFGGNNAHVIVEEWQPQTKVKSAPSVHALSPRMRVAIVGMAAQVADGRTLDDMRAALRAAPPLTLPTPAGTIELPAHGLGIPPNDVEKLLPQQLLALKVARDALAPFRSPPKERMSVIIGMGCDAEACRLSLRLRLPDLLPDTDLRDQICPRVDAAMIVGCMPNIPANRIGRLFDVHGPTFTVSAEELSGIRALEIAARDLASGEADLAVAGAVDLSAEPVHGAAADASLPADRRVPGDAACAFVLKREIDALRDGDPIYAVLDPDYDGAVEWDAGAAVRAHFGHAHAASGALEVMAAALAISDGVLPHSDRKASPWIPDGKPRALAVTVSGLGGARSRVVLHQSLAKPHGVKPSQPDSPDLFVYHGRTIAELASALAQDRRAALPLPPGPRLAFAATAAELPHIRAEAGAFLACHRPGLAPETISSFAFAEDAVPGEIAFVFTGAAAAYRGMGADLLAAAPELADSLGSPNLPQRCGWIYESERGPATSAFAQLCGTSFLSQVHAQWTMQILGIRPQAAIGLSSGETNSLVALGAWNDFDALLDDIESERLYETHISGDYAAPREHWKFIGRAGGIWANYAVRAPVADVEAALRGEPTAYILIVSSPTEVLLGGEAAACRRVIGRLKRSDVVPLDIGVACHTPAIMPCRELWHRLHRRATQPVPGVRFYSNAHGAAYVVSSTAAADALLLQAMRTVDFPRTINRAWEDGVRIFIEHGPRAQCSRWIGETLGQRPHVAIALDSGGGNSLRSALQATARLIVAGVPVNLENVHTLLAPAAIRPPTVEAMRSYPAHRPRLNLVQPTSSAAGPEKMAPAPALAPVLEPVMVRRAATVSLVASPAAAFASAVVEIHRAMTQQHLAYVANAGGLHRTFLAGTATGVALPARPTPAVVRPVQPPEPTPPVPPKAVPAVERAILPRGPRFSRQQLEALATGRISDLFGPQFKAQDLYPRQVRMPKPPLLLADRVLGIDAEPASMGLGTIWTETDITAESWYQHDGRMPAGIAIETGQADVLLISWLGADLKNRGDRMYRLLGCELTYRRGLPAVGDTLRYEIHVDRHASQGDVRLFFFHYDARVNGEVRLSVRNGQAGFFSDEELATSEGILWSPETGEHTADAEARLDPPPRLTRKRSFSVAEIGAFADGKPFECFGAGFEMASPHTRSPRIPSNQMRLLHEIVAFDPQGGPWRRGYLKARLPISPRDWFFEPHFKNDPCMPGTLMFEGCMQALAVYLAALGFTIGRDGWRFEPVMDLTYRLRCRGQVTPQSKELIAEIFIDEIVGGAEPAIYADVLGTVDGLKAFHGRRLGVRLVPDVPLQAMPHVPAPPAGGRPPIETEGVTLDYASLLACAIGRPSAAFGPQFARFDGARRLPRLPGPPYHFMSRIVGLDGAMGNLTAGNRVEADYDAPGDAWYFTDSAAGTMPWCVLLEAALQSCGWLASFTGCPLASDEDLFFRNLDGRATVHREIQPGDGTLRTRAKLTSMSRVGEMTIVGFDVATSLAGGEPVLTMTTTFGFFPARALANQSGLPLRGGEAAPRLGSGVDVFATVQSRIAAGQLMMLDRVSVDAQGGAARLGAAQGEKDVRPDEWFFRAHFYGDPVQPGSLGLEALLQLLQAMMLAQGLDREIAAPRFESVALDRDVTWKFRGQVLPTNKLISTFVEITEILRAEDGVTARANGSLWVDGLKIYEASGFAVRLRASEQAAAVVRPSMRTAAAAEQPPRVPTSFAHSFQGPPNFPAMREFWRSISCLEEWPIADLHFGLIEMFVEAIEIHTPELYDRLRGRPVLFIGNHQVGIESILFNVIASALLDIPTLTIAKAEHRSSWMGGLTALGQSFPGARQPNPILFFDRQNPQDLLDLLARYRTAAGQLVASLMLHADGTRALSCRTPVARLSSVFTDLAVGLDLPVIPIRFAGGLPVEPMRERLEFPVGFAKQRYIFGTPILPQDLSGLPPAERPRHVLAILSALPPTADEERPGAARPELYAAIRRHSERLQVDEARAAAIEILLRGTSGDPLAHYIRDAIDGRAEALPDGSLGPWLERFFAWLGVPSPRRRN